MTSQEYGRSPGIVLKEVQAAAKDCQACDLWMRATQTVFGEGNPHASIMLVGEQPGDVEDVAGRPFVWSRPSSWTGRCARRAFSGAPPMAPYVVVTVHPSSVLRAPDDESRRQ